MDTLVPALSPVFRATRSLVALTLATGLTLGGCYAHGQKTDQHTLQDLYAHRATYYDVVAQLGAPQSEVRHSDGSRQVVYSYTQMQENWQNRVLFVDRFGGGTTSEYTQAVLYFDASGAFTHFTWSGGKDKTGYGLNSGKRQ